jgi:hypothetical protein
MADPRPQHTTLNQPFNGAATALYGPRGPVGPAHTGRQEPQSLADHVDLAIDRVKGLGPKQRLALHNEICRMLRDIDVIRLVAHSAREPGPATHMDAQGNVYTG